MTEDSHAPWGDFELLAMGMAAPVAAGTLAAFAVLALRHEAIWPRWLGWLAAPGRARLRAADREPVHPGRRTVSLGSGCR